MSHKMLRPFIVKVSVLGYFPLIKFVTKSYSVTNCGSTLAQRSRNTNVRALLVSKWAWLVTVVTVYLIR